MENLSTYTNYEGFKASLDNEVKKVAEGFVKIGYLLNIAAETDILLESGYTNVKEFAMAEYKLDESQVSRFINIYKEFGIAGRPELQERYREHGVAKLGMMLTLPEYVREEIPASFSKAEINTLKKEIEEEKKISDIEVMLEKKDEVQQSLPEGLKQVVFQFIHNEPEKYVGLYKAITMEDVKEVIAPNGEDSCIIRVPGVGKLAIFANASKDIVITNLRSGDKDTYTWEQLYEAAKEHMAMGDSAEESWSNVFKEPFPKKEKAEEPQKNNVGQEKPQSKPAPKKESRVKVSKPLQKPEPKPEPQEEVKEAEPQVPGQDNIMNHPEYLPEDIKKEVLTGEVENIEPEKEVENAGNPDEINVQQVSETPEQQSDWKVEQIAPVQDHKEIIRDCKADIRASLTIMEDKYEQEDWDSIISKATNIVWRAKKIKELEGKN